MTYTKQASMYHHKHNSILQLQTKYKMETKHVHHVHSDWSALKTKNSKRQIMNSNLKMNDPLSPVLSDNNNTSGDHNE